MRRHLILTLFTLLLGTSAFAMGKHPDTPDGHTGSNGMSDQRTTDSAGTATVPDTPRSNGNSLTPSSETDPTKSAAPTASPQPAPPQTPPPSDTNPRSESGNRGSPTAPAPTRGSDPKRPAGSAGTGADTSGGTEKQP